MFDVIATVWEGLLILAVFALMMLLIRRKEDRWWLWLLCLCVLFTSSVNFADHVFGH